LLVKRSIITNEVIVVCQKPAEGAGSEVLSYLLLRQAQDGCGLFCGF
jgi:hypothetical protein